MVSNLIQFIAYKGKGIGIGVGELLICKFLFFIFKDFIYLFLDRGEGRETERERECVVAFQAPPTGDLACNPGMCPDWESNQPPIGSQVGAQSTEPHQPGHM